MSIKVYDLEVYSNFFSIVYSNIDSDEYHRLYVYRDVNQIGDIIELFKSKDWFVGYNSTFYDDRIIAYILDNEDYFRSIDPELLCFEIYTKSQEFIDNLTNDYKWKVPFNRFDLMRIGNIQKSLKLVAVDLRHPLIQDLPYHFTHEVIFDEVEEILDYNENDTIITKKLYFELRDEIRLRQNLSKKYGINLMNESDSSIANRILEKDYHKATGIWYSEFKSQQTNRDKVNLGECLNDKIEFKTENLNKLVTNIQNTHVDQRTKIEFNAIIGKTRYDIKKGGLHSNMPPKIYSSSDEYIIIDGDVISYYPRVMLNNSIKPAHIDSIFLDILDGYVTDRITAKAEGDKIAADGLKIVINSIFGKLGSEFHWLKDIFAMYQVTLIGQLSLLMWIEALELAGIKVFYANTDGITALVHKDQVDTYYEIADWWQEHHSFKLEFEEYSKCVIQNVNSYLWIDNKNNPKYKNFFDINRHADFERAFDKPIVPKAIYNFFMKDIAIEDTIRNHTDIHDYCMAQKAGSNFDIKINLIENGRMITKDLQNTNRYFVGKQGGYIYKESNTSSKKLGIIAGEGVHVVNNIEDTDASKYPIKFQYYEKEANKILDLFKHEQTDLFL